MLAVGAVAAITFIASMLEKVPVFFAIFVVMNKIKDSETETGPC
jgi:hypothetical protein